jgi:hypothetical protein
LFFIFAKSLSARVDFALSEALQVGASVAPNPFREQVFRNVENRSFRFDYKFFPRSPSEAQAVKNIIQKNQGKSVVKH